MISISDALYEIVPNYPLIEEGLINGFINCSAFARQIKPQIEKRLYKSVKEGAITMALKRMSFKLRKNEPVNNIYLSDLTVRSNLSEFTFQNSPTILEKTRELFNTLESNPDQICTLAEGIRQTTYIVSDIFKKRVKKIFRKEVLISSIDNLSSITIHYPKEIVYIPGVYYRILKKLAWENINVIEVLSTYTELIIVVESKNVDRAFSVLRA